MITTVRLVHICYQTVIRVRTICFSPLQMRELKHRNAESLAIHKESTEFSLKLRVSAFIMHEYIFHYG